MPFSHVEKLYYTFDPLPDPSGYEEGDLMFDIPNEDIYVLQGGAWVLIDAPPAIKYYETYNDVRSASSIASPMLLVGGRSAVGDGGAGFFVKDNSITLGDNDGSVLVDADGNKWERVFGNIASAKWFLGSGGTYDISSSAITNLYNIVYQYHGHYNIEWSEINLTINNSATFSDPVVFIGGSFVVGTPSNNITGPSPTEQVEFRDCRFEMILSSNVGVVFYNTHIIGCDFVSPGSPPPDTNTSFISINEGSVCEQSNFIASAGGMGLSVDRFHKVYAIGTGIIRNSNIEWLTQSRGLITSSNIDVKVYGPVAAWDGVVEASYGGVVSSCNIKVMLDRIFFVGVGSNRGLLTNNKIDITLGPSITSSYGVVPVNLYGGSVLNNSIELTTTNTFSSGGANIVSFNIDFGQTAFISGNNFSWVSSPTPSIAIYIHGSWGSEVSKTLIANNTFVGNGSGTGIYANYDAGYFGVYSNMFENMEYGINANPSGTHPNIVGNSNIFINVVNPTTSFYTNTTADQVW